MPNPSHRSFDSESQRLVVDHAKLGHHFAYLGSPLSKFIDEQQEKIERLQAENERLRKAGDAMADKIRYDEKTLDEDWGVEGREHRTVQAWNAAKGVQS